MAVDIASWALLAGGGLFCIVGGVGMLRMPDFYMRVHAASLCDTVGELLVLAGLALQSGLSLVTAKLFVVAALILMTSPVATHALVRAALGRGLAPRLAGGEAPSKRS